MCQLCSRYRSCPRCDWRTPAHVHLELVNEHIREALRQCFPKQADQRPRKEYVTQATWEHIWRRASLRKSQQHKVRCFRRALLIECIHSWQAVARPEKWSEAQRCHARHARMSAHAEHAVLAQHAYAAGG